MHSFKKLVKTVLIFAVFFIIGSIVVMAPYLMGENNFYQDASIRKEVQGTTEVAVVGASRAVRGIDLKILEEKTGKSYYTYANMSMSPKGKYYMLKKELKRNPIDTVILEVSYDTIFYNRDEIGSEGDIYTIGRFANPLEAGAFFFWAIHPSEYVDTYHFLMMQGVEGYKDILKRDFRFKNNEETFYKGYKAYLLDHKNMKANYKKLYHTMRLYDEINEEAVEYTQNIVDLCKANDIRVIMVSMPIAKQYMVKYSDFDLFTDWIHKFAGENELEYYPFDIMKERDSLLSEKKDFKNSTHLHNTGAKKFTEYLAETLNKVDAGEDVSDQFFHTYKEYYESIGLTD